MRQLLTTVVSSVPQVKDGVIHATTSGFAVMATTFLQDSFAHMIPWLMVTFAVVACDLITGVRKSLLMGEQVRISSACRRTMGKLVTYTSFVMMVCMICIASGAEYGIDKWSCLLVCGIEGVSIMGNILKPKGYKFNPLGLTGTLLVRMFGGAKEDYKDIITKEEEKKA